MIRPLTPDDDYTHAHVEMYSLQASMIQATRMSDPAGTSSEETRGMGELPSVSP